jgi:hypothetical protein
MMAIADALTRFHERIEGGLRPDILFHYTTGEGAVGILETGELRATHARYLNDSLELEAGMSLAKETLERVRSTVAASDEVAIYERISDALDAMTIEDFFVASFSAQADDLPQWRAYSKGAGGYALGFTAEHLILRSNESGFYLYPVVYDVDVQSQLLEAFMADLVKVRRNVSTWDGDPEVPEKAFGSLMRRCLGQLAVLFKHPSFSHEAEWRLISLDDRKRPSLRLRPSRTMLVPFVCVPMYNEARAIPVAELWIGPSPHQGLSHQAVDLLVSLQRLECGSVHESKCPFRDW